jgi:hypothetical protein
MRAAQWVEMYKLCKSMHAHVSYRSVNEASEADSEADYHQLCPRPESNFFAAPRRPCEINVSRLHQTVDNTLSTPLFAHYIRKLAVISGTEKFNVIAHVRLSFALPPPPPSTPCSKQ